jgi:hypothetical protein
VRRVWRRRRRRVAAAALRASTADVRLRRHARVGRDGKGERVTGREETERGRDEVRRYFCPVHSSCWWGGPKALIPDQMAEKILSDVATVSYRGES